MNGDAIRKGDLAVCEERDGRGLPVGTLVAALVRDRVVLRQFEFANGRVHLRAADRTYGDEAFAPADDECFIVGAVRAILRAL